MLYLKHLPGYAYLIDSGPISYPKTLIPSKDLKLNDLLPPCTLPKEVVKAYEYLEKHKVSSSQLHAARHYYNKGIDQDKFFEQEQQRVETASMVETDDFFHLVDPSNLILSRLVRRYLKTLNP